MWSVSSVVRPVHGSHRILCRCIRQLKHYQPALEPPCSSRPACADRYQKMKRSASTVVASRKVKRAREKEPDYHLTPSVRGGDGEIIWPAPTADIENARRIIRECAAADARTLIVPDKDADGLTSGLILSRTLQLLGLAKDRIAVHLLEKGTNVHSPSESARMAAARPAYIFVLDQGSRAAPPLIPAEHTALIIDHHFAQPTDFPENSQHVNASHFPPVATSSLLTFEICKPLHDAVEQRCAWLACVGTHGDLGSGLKWGPPFPDMAATLKAATKKAVADAVALLNAPRRSPAFDVLSAWTALEAADSVKDVLDSPRLWEARRAVNDEVERCTHAAPKFSRDGRVAVLRIESAAQVHPLIATRWAQHLSSRLLEVVLVANTGYATPAGPTPTKTVHFSCRISRAGAARRAQAGEPPIDIIALLRDYAARHESGDLLQRMGDNFARGHVQASGGIVGEEEFEDLMRGMGVGEKPEGESPRKKKSVGPAQANTIGNYFAKKEK